MNKTMTITVITLVAVVMGISSVAPALASNINCPGDFVQASTFENPDREDKDRNGNTFVCVKTLPNGNELIIDDIPQNPGGGELPPGGGGGV